MNSLPSNELSDRIFEKENLIEGFRLMVSYKQLFLSFKISDGPKLFCKILRGRWALDNVCTGFRDFTKISSFPLPFDNL